MTDDAPEAYAGVMISGTFTDLEEHRKALEKALQDAGLHPITMKSSPELGDVIDVSLAMVRAASAVILLISHKYGQTPPCPDRNPRNLSITELEFNEAMRLKRPLLLLTMGDEHSVLPGDVERDPKKIKKLEAFRKRAKNIRPDSKVHRVYATFNSLVEFEKIVIGAAPKLRAQITIPSLVQNSPAAPPPPPATPLPPANPPALRANPPYRGRQRFIGRLAQLDTLDDWSNPANPDPLFLLHAIGGMGKSALAWHWLEQQAGKPWAGCFWFSFYERGATMAAFVTHALAYVTARRPADLPPAPMQEQAAELLIHLRARPFLFVLDGAERLLASYHRYDAAQMRDEEADSMEASATTGTDPCATIRPADAELLRELAAAAPSKLLLTSRLVPTALLNPARQPLPGARIEPLPGMRPAEAEQLLRSFGIDGTGEAMQRFLQESCGCHPLVIGALAGLINRPGRTRGHFDAWLPHPQGGAALNLATLDLRQRQNHIVATALAEVPASGQRVLAALSLLAGAADWETLEALCPELNNLADAVDDLERRGLLFFEADEYDLHPVVRSLALARLAKEDRDATGERVIDHFNSLPHSPYEEAQTLADVEPGLQVVRTLLALGRREDAVATYRGELAQALLFNLEAAHDTLSLLRPLFPAGWHVPPAGLSPEYQSYMLNEVALAVRAVGNVAAARLALDATVEIDLALRAYHNLAIGLGNLSSVLADTNFSTKEAALIRKARLVARLTDDDASLFSRTLDLFDLATDAGHHTEAATLRTELDAMGRDWPRYAYRPGDAEYRYALADFRQGHLAAATLDAAAATATAGRNRGALRNLHTLRGRWHLDRGEPALAHASLEEAVAMARAVRQFDSNAESWLALARHRAGRLPDPEAEAARLAALPKPNHEALAELHAAIGNTQAAIRHATEAYRWAWADGEPHVHRFELTRAAALLHRLGAPIPTLPPYDPANDPVFPWEPALAAAIAQLEAERTKKKPARPKRR